ncbi:MAG: hypothetical protein GY789_17365 [Hyphomicrobiales bacterium]|nr:hypothetical protein [Hyphomicrobiales bacterium]
MSFDGQVENDLSFFDYPTDFLVPMLPDGERMPSGLDYDRVKDALPFVLSGSAANEYEPLGKHPALFRELAYIEPTWEGISQFANHWGALGSEGTCEFIRVDDDGTELDEFAKTWGESIWSWTYEAGMMHDAVVLWDSAHRRDKAILNSSIWFDGDSVCWHSVPDGWSFSGAAWVSAPDHHPDRYYEIRRHGLARAALYIVQDLVNEGLRARVHEQLVWDEIAGRPTVRIIPINLVGALWLQFANAIEGNHDFGQCASCGSWFVVVPGAGRPDKRYCSDACRMRAYRKRKKAPKKRARRAVR